MALKADVSFFDDRGINPYANGGAGGPNPVYHADKDGDGDVTVLSLSLDFVF
jgi:hypothetical protein